MAERELARFFQLLMSHSKITDFSKHPDHFGFDLGTLAGVEHRVDPEEPGLTLRIAPCIDGMGERGFVAEFFVKARAASAAEDNRKDVERGNVGMRERRDVPGEV